MVTGTGSVPTAPIITHTREKITHELFLRKLKFDFKFYSQAVFAP